MAFVNKTDYFGISTTGVEITAANDGKTAAVATATDERGDIVANTVHTEALHPSNDFIVSKDVSLSVTLGTVNSAAGKPCMLREVSITTAAGAAPTISASGDEVENGATTDATVSAQTFAISHYHKAQALMGITVTGGNLTNATYTLSAEATIPTADGVIKAHDIHGASIVAALTISATTGTAPTVSGTGWTVTSPAACSNPNEDYPTYTATLTKWLDSSEAS